MTLDQPALARGRHRRPDNPHAWLARPAFGDHRQDRLGPPPPMGSPIEWHVAGSEESLLLRPPSEGSVARQVVGRKQGHPKRVLLTFVLVIACFLGTFAGTVFVSDVAHASTRASIGSQLLNWEQAHENGRPYAWGGTGPYGYDCSGAIYAAALRVLPANGIRLSWPRDTYDLRSAVYSGRLRARIIPVSQAQRGDILIWPGWGHAEIKTKWPGVSYGALKTGTPVGWHTYNRYWYPMLAIRLLY